MPLTYLGTELTRVQGWVTACITSRYTASTASMEGHLVEMPHAVADCIVRMVNHGMHQVTAGGACAAHLPGY